MTFVAGVIVGAVLGPAVIYVLVCREISRVCRDGA